MKKVRLTIEHEIGAEELGRFMLNNSHEDLLEFVALIDLSQEDWGFTERLIAHFKALELELMKECPEDGPVEPKKINVKR